MRSQRRGMTILEVLVASSLLLLGLFGVVQLIYAGDVTERRGEQKYTGTLVATEVMEQLRAMPFTDLVPGTFTNTVTLDGRSFDRKIIIANMADAGMATVEVTVQVTFVDLLSGLSKSSTTELHSTFTTALFPDGGLL